MNQVTQPLQGKIALVAGATRGAGRQIAVQLGAAGATVYATGRSTRERRSEMDRPETIEETAELVTEAGGVGIAVPVDHLEPERVQALVQRIDREQGRLDVLVNDVWGADPMIGWEQPLWQHSLTDGLRTLRLAIDTHLITSHFALPLLIRSPGGLVVEVGDGTREYNDANYRNTAFYDLAKVAVNRLAFSQAARTAAVRGDRGRAHPGLAAVRDDARPLRRHRGELAGRDRQGTALRHLGVTGVRRSGRRRARRRPGPGPLVRPVAVQRPTRPGVRLHRSRRQPARCLAVHAWRWRRPASPPTPPATADRRVSGRAR